MPETFTFGDMLSARSVIGETLAAEGAKRDNLWVLTPDIGATLVEFRDTFPDRFIDVGLAEQACVGIAAGLAYDGNIPVVSGMLPFLSMRALEQVRSDICYPNLPVKSSAPTAGSSATAGRPTTPVEDLSLMASLTNMTVTSIGDPVMVGEVLRQSMEMSRARSTSVSPSARRTRSSTRQASTTSGSARASSPAMAPTSPSSRTARPSRRRSTPPTSSRTRA